MTPRVFRPALATTVLLAALAASGHAQEPPPELTAPVNDFAGIIDPGSEARLDRLIRTLQAASGDVIAVATVKTFQPAGDIRAYASEMFENRGRGIGQKGKDNGLLVLVAQDDRAVWVEVGYDLEALVTDGFAGETSRQVMAPYFRRGEYGPGLVAGVTRVAQRIAEGRKVSLEGVPAAQPRQVARDQGIPVGLWILLAFVLLNLLTGRRRRRRRGFWSSSVGPFGVGYGGWSTGGLGGGSWSGGGGFGGGFGGFGGGRSGGGGGGASW